MYENVEIAISIGFLIFIVILRLIHSMPQVLLGLLSVWNVSFLGSPARVRLSFLLISTAI